MYVMDSVSPANDLSPPLRFSDIEGNRTKPPPPTLVPPPPPPLLPPPPPPPIPPLLPGLGDPAGGGLRKKKRVRSFFWKTIPEEQVKGRANLWTQGRVQQQYQIDVQTIEELFGQSDGQSNAKATPTPTRGGRSRSSFRESKEEVSILDSKRGMNIGIFLKQFKRSNQTIVDDIRHGNSEPYGAEPLRELLKLLPETEEVKNLKSYRGDTSKLSLADSFVYLLVQLPSYSVRIESMLLKEEFPEACEAMKRDIRVLRSAVTELMRCEELHAVLHLVLQAGNILNAGGYAGNAVGFKLSSLLSLADTKANKPGMNLLHFVALEAQKKDGRLLEFPAKLSHVQAAARISIETLDTDLQWLMTRTRSVEESVQRDTELLQQLDSFLQSATSSLCSLRGSRQHLRKEGSELIDFFCEDRETFRLDDCFSIFHTFCSRFTDAVKENMEREAKEAARRRRLQELEEQKRHSWAGGEEVSGGFRLRCSSEADMSAAMSRQDDAGLLMELLTPKSRPRSPLSNSQGVLGRSGSLRRSRNSPSSSPSIVAERELSTLLEMATPDHKVTQQRGGEDRTAFRSASPKPGLRSPGLSPQALPQSPRVTTCSFPQNQQPQAGVMAPQTSLSPPKTSWSPKTTNAHHTTSTYLSYDAPQTPVDAINSTKKVTVKPTSDANQQSDYNNNGKDQPGLGFSSHVVLPDHRTQSGFKGEPTRMNKGDQDFRGQITCSDERFEYSTTRNMSVVLETCTLVPELKVFDEVTTLTGRNEGHHTSHLFGRQQDDMVITDLEEEGVDKTRVQKPQKKSQVENAENSQISETSSSQRDEGEGHEEKVVVWCVTGVCEAAGELSHTDDTHGQTEKNQCRSDNQGGNQQASSAPANHPPSEPQSANEKPVPEPISSQPVPVSRCDDPSLQVSSPRWRPAEPASANEAPALTTDASEEGKESANHGEGEETSTNETRDVVYVPEESTGRNNSASSHTNNENTEPASTNGKPEPATSSKPSTKDTPTSKTRPAGMKPSATQNTTSTTNKSKPVRTLTNSENQGMRRVVPISRTSRGTSSAGSRPEKPPGQKRGPSSTAALTSLTVSNLNSTSLRRGERPSTAPSSRRSSIHKTQDPKDLKDQKVSGTQASAREQNQDLQRKPSIRKPLTKPKIQQEEKMCRSTLRALSQAGEGGGGGGSISAPVTPLHKGSSPSSSQLPGFARNTASSSFRRTHATLAPPAPSHSSHPDSSHKSSVVPPDRSFSDKSTHSRDSVKATRPSWR
ncbi:FH2 domain-containing protein 1-like isoform X2 [Toxotes jaculatrix]|uniref:FH2 domain-containing protein 1-like isoform X2 n=1 Tax=Toxotes jaculatrix TaxID=941984 RepID=UPI001B3AE351|nr:FH2 domain-containing protein 1-like isoform X2 [Toxotes jaculatrix]